ncbi:hypothetical protein R1flu_005648 [Riccia fluitans]|uniref:Integrase catalytic domain-containing protein n=1 Tax=Riccia fluitans TaxID=41844 RepID=A0ABD1YUP8_9MARC
MTARTAQRLGLTDLQPCKKFLRLADQSRKQLLGKLKDIETTMVEGQTEEGLDTLGTSERSYHGETPQEDLGELTSAESAYDSDHSSFDVYLSQWDDTGVDSSDMRSYYLESLIKPVARKGRLEDETTKKVQPADTHPLLPSRLIEAVGATPLAVRSEPFVQTEEESNPLRKGVLRRRVKAVPSRKEGKALTKDERSKSGRLTLIANPSIDCMSDLKGILPELGTHRIDGIEVDKEKVAIIVELMRPVVFEMMRRSMTTQFPSREEVDRCGTKVLNYGARGSTGIFGEEVSSLLTRCLEQKSTEPYIVRWRDFGIQTTAKKILAAGYWWPTVFRDVATYVKACDPCQRTGRPTASTRRPLVPILPLAPFEKWGIDFVGPVAPASRRQKRYVLVATDYFTRMVEAEATRRDDATTVAAFLFERIVCRYGMPLELVSDRGTHFVNDLIQEMAVQYGIKHRRTTLYNPKANGLTESPMGFGARPLQVYALLFVPWHGSRHADRDGSSDPPVQEEDRLKTQESMADREVNLLRLHEEREKELEKQFNSKAIGRSAMTGN